jgi:tellurite resistance-related uncharacterized protein
MKPQMQRRMTGFHQDEESYWVAELECGHTQHVRHQPPFTLRPWVLTSEGRAGRVGQMLECSLCDRREMPRGFAPYKRTATFTRDSVPAALLRRHDTKAGIWAIVHVVSGNLEYFEPTETGETRLLLGPSEQVTVPAEREHRVALTGETTFFIEFWHRAAGDG